MPKKIKRIEDNSSKVEETVQVEEPLMEKTEVVVLDGIVTVRDKEPDKMSEEMQEVSYEEYRDQLLSKEIQKDTKSKIRELVGKTKAEAISLIESMILGKEVGSFRIIPIGAMYSQEYVADRVQVFVDNQGQVLDINIG